MAKKQRQQTPRRYKDIKGTTRIDSARQIIANTLGLPVEAVWLHYPSGNCAPYNSTVDHLRWHWEQNG
jgi:hypothetical protein